MFNFIYDFVFSIASLFILLKSISYGLFEINTQNNKIGGISVISFSILVTIFVNFIIWTK